MLNELPPLPKSEDQLQQLEDARAKLKAVFAEMYLYGIVLPPMKELISDLDQYIALARLDAMEEANEHQE